MTFDIQKRAEELLREASEKTAVQLMGIPLPGVDWAIQLAREAADARAEEIASAIEASNLMRLAKKDLLEMEDFGISSRTLRDVAVKIARSTISKPETREQRLEKALRECAKMCSCAYGTGEVHQHHERCSTQIARRALEET